MKDLLNQSGCIDYLINNDYEDILFISQSDNTITFQAFCTDNDQIVYIQFEQTDNETVFVNVKYNENEPYNTLERLSIND